MHTIREVVQICLFFYGFYFWGIKRDRNQNPTPITNINPKIIALILILVTLFSFLYASDWAQNTINTYLMTHRTNHVVAWKNFIDMFASLMHIIGLSLMSRRIIQSWFLWIIIDFINIPLYLSLNLNAQAIKCMLYLGIATYGYLHWKTLQNLQNQPQNTTPPQPSIG